jgi:hypothetical protein
MKKKDKLIHPSSMIEETCVFAERSTHKGINRIHIKDFCLNMV